MRLVALEKEEVLRLLEAAKRHGPRVTGLVGIPLGGDKDAQELERPQDHDQPDAG
jgi:hypothetical protein